MRQPRTSENPSFAEPDYRQPKDRANDRSLKPSGHAASRGMRIFGVGVLTAALGFAASDVLSPATQVASAGVSPKPATLQAGTDRAFGPESSANWAGWAISGGTVSEVAGSWTEPPVTCPAKATQAASFWVGIDGLKAADTTIQQIGTAAECVKGKLTYYAWYEMYPAALVAVPKPVAPGDRFTGQVSGSGKKFVLSINATAPGGAPLWQFSITKTTSTAPKASSGEWIAEDPCTGSPCTALPLSDFGTVDFSKISAASLKKVSFTDTELTMETKAKVVKAQPSALTSNGTAFSVTWLHS